MKKTLLVLTLAGLSAVLMMPNLVFAQEGKPVECCKMGRNLLGSTSTVGGVTIYECPKDAWVGPAGGICPTGAAPDKSTDKWGMCCLLNTLYSISDWIFVVLVALSGIFVTIGAFTLLTAAGDATKITSGRNYILYAAIGLVVGMLSRAIPNLVTMIGGLGT